MKLIRPAYFEEFRCIAAACPDSCCKEWDVAVDDMSAAYYRSMEGDLGDRLRQVLYDEDGNTTACAGSRRNGGMMPCARPAGSFPG